jgi:hypothetical protein
MTTNNPDPSPRALYLLDTRLRMPGYVYRPNYGDMPPAHDLPELLMQATRQAWMCAPHLLAAVAQGHNLPPRDNSLNRAMVLLRDTMDDLIYRMMRDELQGPTPQPWQRTRISADGLMAVRIIKGVQRPDIPVTTLRSTIARPADSR